jgi:hypothetical protein
LIILDTIHSKIVLNLMPDFQAQVTISDDPWLPGTGGQAGTFSCYAEGVRFQAATVVTMQTVKPCSLHKFNDVSKEASIL